MGRPERKDVDYFPFYVKNGRTLQILEGKYDCKGTGFFTNVLRFLSTRPDHHFLMAEESDRLWFFEETKCDEKSAIEMLNIMSLTGKINKELWSHQIIASQDYLDSVSDAYRKRTNEIVTMDEIFRHYNVNSRRNTHIAGFPAEETHSGEDKGQVTSADKPQSKVKESKVKKSRQAVAHFEFKVGPLLDHILKQCEIIEKLKQKSKPFNPYMWIQFHTNKSGHPQAILESLEGLIQYWDTVKTPWTYANNIMETKSQNYREADHLLQHYAFKKTFEINPRIKELLPEIGK
ncbi:hypothetical protein KAR91_55225 [Candidatus Pacearchaeota archaeon]|nr:hypothetical protein [Candidatus Pacearchaeota archaeon]